MKKFEYTLKWKPDIFQMNSLGQNGWELVCVRTDDYYLFKRELAGKTDNTIC